MQRAPLPVDMLPVLWDNSIQSSSIATWWLLRELEAAALQIGDAHSSEELMVATLNLAASKTNMQAKGTWVCVCCCEPWCRMQICWLHLSCEACLLPIVPKL
eukprot:3698158-Amphidinium_carterae.1